MLETRNPQGQPFIDTLLVQDAFRTRVKGRCMAPLIRNGDTVRIDPAIRLRCGDVFVWRDRHGRMVCHRYIGRFPGRDGLGYISWADDADRPDALVTRLQVLGKVTHVGESRVSGRLPVRLRAAARYLRYGLFRLRLLIAG